MAKILIAIGLIITGPGIILLFRTQKTETKKTNKKTFPEQETVKPAEQTVLKHVETTNKQEIDSLIQLAAKLKKSKTSLLFL